jgi:small subunit ribosomal protein S4
MRINRRFGLAIFNPKRAFERKPHLPGMHGPRLRRRETEYSLGLNEKQKLCFKYGLNHRQMRNAFLKAKATQGVTGDILLQGLESRLDNVLYMAGFARSRPAARQLVAHGHVRINGQKVDIPGYVCQPGDQLTVRQKSGSLQLVTRNVEGANYRTPPAWLTVEFDSLNIVFNRPPIRSEMDQSINDQRVVEFFSR